MERPLVISLCFLNLAYQYILPMYGITISNILTSARPTIYYFGSRSLVVRPYTTNDWDPLLCNYSFFLCFKCSQKYHRYFLQLQYIKILDFMKFRHFKLWTNVTHNPTKHVHIHSREFTSCSSMPQITAFSY